jgi:hypothetical protein
MRRLLLLVALASCGKTTTLEIDFTGDGFFRAYSPDATQPDLICDQSTVPCRHDFSAGTDVLIEVQASPGFHFDHLATMDVMGLDPAKTQQTVRLASNGGTEKIQVVFTEDPTLQVFVPTGHGTVDGTQLDASRINCPPTCTTTYPLGTMVDLTAKPALGYRLLSWTADPPIEGLDPTAPALHLQLDASQTIVARFESDEASCNVSDTETALPVITSLGPTGTVCGGDTIVVNGMNLGGDGACAQVNGRSASSVTGTSDQVSVVVSPGTPAGQATVRLTTSQGVVSQTSIELVVSSGTIPSIDGVSPGSVSGGQTVTVDGLGLSNATVQLAGGTTVPASLVSDTDTRLQFIVPGGAAPGDYSVVVTTPCGMATSAGKITVS